MLVAQRPVVGHAALHISLLGIERGRLKAVSIEDRLAAAAESRLVLGHREHANAVAVPALVLAHPENLDLERATPGVASQSAKYVAAVVAEEDGQRAIVRMPVRAMLYSLSWSCTNSASASEGSASTESCGSLIGITFHTRSMRPVYSNGLDERYLAVSVSRQGQIWSSYVA